MNFGIHTDDTYSTIQYYSISCQNSEKNSSAFTTMSTSTTNTLLLVDVQNDFHPPKGSLAIPTAGADAERIAILIRQNTQSIDRVVVTLDTHQKLHIAHPCFWWSNDTGESRRHPEPFTIITANDIRNAVWQPRSDLHISLESLPDPTIFTDMEKVQDDTTGTFDLTKYCLEYAIRLEAAGRFQICIWPEHCLIGTPGHNVVECIHSALTLWTETTGHCVEYIFKGQNILTEMYSALAADVPVTVDTQFNHTLHESLLMSSLSSKQSSTPNRLIVCGQALSHCVNYTVRDIVTIWPMERRSEIILLQDCTSAVPGFESAATTFVQDMMEAGIQIRSSTDKDLFMGLNLETL